MNNPEELFDVSLLIVDDDIASGLYISQILCKFVKNIYTAGDGEEGINIYKNKPIDLVISDIDMPNLNGIEMSRQIKNINHSAYIIMTTAVDNKDAIIEAIDIGINKYIIKPIDKDKLITAVRNAVISILMKKELAEKNLRIEKFIVGLEQSDNAVLITDLVGEIEYANKKFRDVFGKYTYLNDFFNIHNISDGELIKNGEITCEKSISHSESKYIEFSKYVDGEEKWFKMKFSFIYPDNESKNILIIITDITKDILSRKEIELINSELEQRVISRTEQLHKSNRKLMKEIEARIEIENQLTQAKDKAEAANKAKSSFLGKITHELRTPLNGILGLTGIMIDEIKDERYINFLKMMQDAGNSLLDIINKILDLTKIESGNLLMSFHKFSLRKLIDECVGLYTHIALTKNVNFYYKIDDTIPDLFYSDSKRIRQVIINLLSNAFKFTDKGEISIIINMVGSNAKYSNLEFRVSDTGIGIPKESYELLFKNFSQIDESYTRRHEGLGLGLGISKGIIDLLDGEIKVESQINKGSAFIFTLPLETVKNNI